MARCVWAMKQESNKRNSGFKELPYKVDGIAFYDLGWVVWSNRYFIAIACAVFIGGVAIAVIADGVSHHATLKLGGKANGIVEANITYEDLLEALNETSIGQILSHNVRVSVHMLILGMAFGVGTLILLVLNGMAVGYMLTLIWHVAPCWATCTCIFAHAPIELAGVVLAGAGGLRLGYGITKAILHSSLQHLQNAMLEALQLGFISVTALAVASLVEGFISFSPNVSPHYKVAIGIASLLILVACMRCARTRWLRNTHSAISCALASTQRSAETDVSDEGAD